MKKLESNILSIYRERGRLWLDELQKHVRQLEALWGLSHLKPLDNLTYNYVLSGFQDDLPIILKLSLNTSDLEREAKALNAFEGFGGVSVLNKNKNAILLEQALPGNPLKNYHIKDGKKCIEVACNIARRLQEAPLPTDFAFPRIEDWLAALDKEWKIPRNLLQKARTLKEQLLAKMSALPVLLHGDLHQDNILSHGDDWLVIDPKGVIGFPINEIWACVEKPSHDLKYISECFNYSYEEVVQWYYVHLILAACWQVEDNLDPSLFLDLAQSVRPMIKD
jgi:streptomycin 6-kinase